MRVWDLTYTLLYIKQINNKDLPYNTGNYIKYFIVAYNGKESEKNTHIYTCSCAVLSRSVVSDFL